MRVQLAIQSVVGAALVHSRSVSDSASVMGNAGDGSDCGTQCGSVCGSPTISMSYLDGAAARPELSASAAVSGALEVTTTHDDDEAGAPRPARALSARPSSRRP